MVGFCQSFKPVKDTLAMKTMFRQKAMETKSIKAKFTETKLSPYLKETQQGKGLLYFERDRKLRWEKTLPQSFIFLSVGEKSSIFEQGKQLQAVGSDKISEGIREMMNALLDGSFLDGKGFSQAFHENETTYQILLTPVYKQLAKVFKNIELRFRKTDLALSMMVFDEKSGGKTTFVFSEQGFNSDIDDSFFTKP